MTNDTKNNKPTTIHYVVAAMMILIALVGIPFGAIAILNLLPFITIEYTFINWVISYVGIWIIERVTKSHTRISDYVDIKGD